VTDAVPLFATLVVVPMANVPVLPCMPWTPWMPCGPAGPSRSTKSRIAALVDPELVTEAVPLFATLVVVPIVIDAAEPAGPWVLAYSGPRGAAGAMSAR
jgi:hypothetical protein